mmetsp:Transcript_101645/g.152322  ORF Transcript_101645/g.152322 Transcript_101645/m.152322 type:complete len:180 (-) Transcript_101645:292-831(-)|eukprot:CAMPEP_0117005098 /NCGR_PEP_ID=MMETSP0472-20121206/5839_1 /TAXON_ID=693140 ORGANISM="Tiarina fusus, Strain LIS" /NCGR_SAMPLE_ID=MMETSP0472 /ASSEMBLY_ACC=CAM_ASM_000603 /LENGTH=179 /DNA_ID=CAMNT_0004706249 /DNA_START=14 /DNA_END=553 /DNA_ORIENTATION=-
MPPTTLHCDDSPAQPFNRPTRVGIDFGNTIGEIDEPCPAPGAVSMIRHLVHKFGPSNVFIVSKAQPSMQMRIQEWLDGQSFYSQTGLLRDNTIFVREYADKAQVVQALGISVFFDDSNKVVRALSPLPGIRRIFWMHARDTRLIRLVAKEDRFKIAMNPSGSWNSTMKYFQRIRGQQFS